MNRRQVSQEEMRSMFEDEKLSDEEIGARIDLSRESAARLRERRGFYRMENRANIRNRIPDDVIDKCRALLLEGYSYRAVSQMMNVSQGRIAKHLPGMGFTREQTKEAAMMGRKLSEIS